MEKIERANKDFCLFEGAGKILVGLSGGADSTCLLLSLKELSVRYGFELCALHVNHMIRGGEADRDEEFAKNLCRELGIEFFCERVDIPALSKKSGESLELCARNVRYEAFSRVCKKRKITHVATAHNACDNAETVLFNLVRGTGTRGLCGIPPKRALCDGVTLIRPLIYAERHEIEEFLSLQNQDFVTDSTNSDIDYTRNYIRNKIMPLLRNINPSVEESIARTARLHRIDEDYLSEKTEKNLSDNISDLSRLHESILSRVIIRLFSRVSDETLPQTHVKALCGKIYEYDGKKTNVSLPYGFSATLYRGKLAFEKDKRCVNRVCGFNSPVVEGSIFFEENPYALYISFDQNEDIPQTLENNEIIYKKYTTDYLYFDKIPDRLNVRNRHDGDKIFSGKQNKSVKRLMVSSEYRADERYLVPFICDGDRILLVPAVSVCDDCRKNAERKTGISVSLFCRQHI